MIDFSQVSLKNKIFFLTFMVILIISIAIAFLARWILISSLAEELKIRGIAIARSISERGSTHILEDNTPELLGLIYDEATLSERKNLINYIFVLDKNNKILCHTLTQRLPAKLAKANPLPRNKSSSVALVSVDGQKTYDIAVPAMEGIHRIATVHVGLSKGHIENLVSKLRTTFLGFIFVIIIILFIISHYLARQITQPIAKLTRISDELSGGNFDLDPKHFRSLEPENRYTPSEHIKDVFSHLLHPKQNKADQGKEQKIRSLRKNVPSTQITPHQRRDEVGQLANSFMNMLKSIHVYRKRLQESESKYRSLFDSGPDPIYVVDQYNYRILDANPRAEETYQYSREEMIGKSFLDLGPEHNREIIERFENDPDINGLEHYPKRLQYKKDGTPFFVNIRISPISYEGTQAVIIASTDITDMIEKDAQLIQASKMKSLGEMSAGMAHELNQPLNAIRMGTDFLLMSAENEQDIASSKSLEILRDITEQVDRATGIINNLRAFGRKSTLFKKKIDINTSLSGVLSVLMSQFNLDNIEFKVSLGENIPFIYAHDNRLQQVFFNVISNSRDAILERMKKEPEFKKGLINISTSFNSRIVTVRIEDNGIGISEEIQANMFEPFFTTKETGQGMGLGLAISYGIIRDYGGSHHIESVVGQGTTFTMHFPRADQAGSKE